MESTIVARIAAFVKSFWYDLFVLGCIICIAVISYNLGRVRALKQTPVTVSEGANIFTADSVLNTEAKIPSARAQVSQVPRDPRVVVSKASTSKKYHHSWCSGAKQIIITNQVWFSTAASAQQAGYTLAGNCQ